MEKRKNLAVVCLTAAFLLGFLLWGLCKPDVAIKEKYRFGAYGDAMLIVD